MVFDSAKKWLFNVFIKKAIKRLAVIIVAWAAGHNLQQWGVILNEEALSVGIWTALEAGRQWLKVKTGWGWL